MHLSRHRSGWYLAVLLICARSALGAEIGVLTPSYSGHLDAELDNTIGSQVTMGLADVLKNPGERTRKLNELAASGGFDLVTALNKALVDELAKANFSAVVVPIVRHPRPRVAPLARDEVPENANTPLLLDMTLYYAGIYGSGSALLYEPAVLMDYRWVDSSGALVQSSRRIQYNALFKTAEDRGKPQWFASRSTVNSVILKTAPGCQFKFFSEVEEQGQKVWGCMDTALREVAASVAQNVPPIDSFSAGSRSQRAAPNR